MGTSKTKKEESLDGTVEVSLKFKGGEETVAQVDASLFLPFLLEKDQLPMAETRIVEAINSAVNPFRVKIVTYVNEKISVAFAEDTVSSDDVLSLEQTTETETTE